MPYTAMLPIINQFGSLPIQHGFNMHASESTRLCANQHGFVYINIAAPQFVRIIYYWHMLIMHYNAANSPGKRASNCPQTSSSRLHSSDSIQIQAQIDLSKQNALLSEIDRLCTALREQQQQHAQEKQGILKNIVLLSLQIEHMREIHRQYDLKLKNSQDAYDDLESVYALKLETLKKDLMESFAEQLSMEKEATLNELKQLKEIYGSKLALISESSRNQEMEIDLKARAINENVFKITLYETKLENKEREVQKYRKAISELERKCDEKSEDNRKLADKLEILDKESIGNLSHMKQNIEESTSLNAKLHEELIMLKNALNDKESECLKLEEQNSELAAELQSTSRKLRRMENEMVQLNRKTEKNKEHAINSSYNANPRYEEMESMKGNRCSSLTEEHQMGGRSNSRFNSSSHLQQSEQYHRMKEMYNQICIDFEQEKAKREQMERHAGVESSRLVELELSNNHMSGELNRKNTELKELREQLRRVSQEYSDKVKQYSQNIASFQSQRKEQEREFQALQKNIKNQYLKEISRQKQQMQNLQQALDSTNQMIETMAIQRHVRA